MARMSMHAKNLEAQVEALTEENNMYKQKVDALFQQQTGLKRDLESQVSPFLWQSFVCVCVCARARVCVCVCVCVTHAHRCQG